MKHTETYKVRFSETDHQSRLMPLALYNHFQDTAIHHSDAVGLSGAALFERGYAWMIHHLYMEIDAYPVQGDTIHVQTWANNLSGLYAVREWLARTDDGDVFARGTSRWLLIDVRKKRISKLPSFLEECYGNYPEERAIECGFERMSPVGHPELQRVVSVRASEIDTNQHANSAAYLDWCLDAVPHEQLNSYLPRSLEIVYRQECTLGEQVDVRTQAADTDTDSLSFAHSSHRQTDGKLLAAAQTVWIPTEK
jgi:acyl-ACP thioesterase